MSGKFRGMDNLPPHFTLQARHQHRGFTSDHDTSLVDYRHLPTEIGYVGNDMSRKNHDNVFADRAEQVMKADALFGVEAGSGLVHND